MKANNMMTDNDMMCWHALYISNSSLELLLMAGFKCRGYTTYCPMQAVFVKWKGHTRSDYSSFFRMFVCCR